LEVGDKYFCAALILLGKFVFWGFFILQIRQSCPHPIE
jgi:hypothetical protein